MYIHSYVYIFTYIYSHLDTLRLYDLLEFCMVVLMHVSFILIRRSFFAAWLFYVNVHGRRHEKYYFLWFYHLGNKTLF